MSEVCRSQRTKHGDLEYSEVALVAIDRFFWLQDTIRKPKTGSEAGQMKKATTLAIFITTGFYMAVGMIGYGAFGDDAPTNLLTGFGFFNPYWLIDVANVFIMVHLVGAYQVGIALILCKVSENLTSTIMLP